MIGRRQALAVAAIGILGSQAGHLLTFQLLFGSAAQRLQSSGAHAYFPLLAKATLGVVALIFLAGMFVIGLARIVSGRSWVAAGDQKPFVELVVLIVLGHVIAVYLAHLRAGERFRSEQRALLSQYPMLALTVIYTMTSLLILAQQSTKAA